MQMLLVSVLGLMTRNAWRVRSDTPLFDALLPGIEPVWSDDVRITVHSGLVLDVPSGDIVYGKEKEFLTNFTGGLLAIKKNTFTKEETDEFIRAYSIPNHRFATASVARRFPDS